MAEAITIEPAKGAADLDLARTLFREYAASVGAPQCFAGFETELAGLPGAMHFELTIVP